MSVKRWLPFAVFVGLVVLLAFGLQLDPRKLPSTRIDKPLPSFQVSSVESEEVVITNQELIGQPALINIWASWCPSCLAEHAFLMDLAKQGIQIHGINYKDERPKAIAWLNKYGDPYQTNLFDVTGDLGIELGVYGTPETFIIDSEGTIVHKHIGPLDSQKWEQVIKPIMEKL